MEPLAPPVGQKGFKLDHPAPHRGQGKLDLACFVCKRTVLEGFDLPAVLGKQFGCPYCGMVGLVVPYSHDG
jgi:hypothetical protein